MDYKEVHIRNLKDEALWRYEKMSSSPKIYKWDMIKLKEELSIPLYIPDNLNIAYGNHFVDLINKLVEMDQITFDENLPLEEIVKLLE